MGLFLGCSDRERVSYRANLSKKYMNACWGIHQALKEAGEILIPRIAKSRKYDADYGEATVCPKKAEVIHKTTSENHPDV